jgi:hypothetical protein
VAAVVIGRHISRGWQPTLGQTNDALLQALPQPFDWDMCAVH